MGKWTQNMNKHFRKIEMQIALKYMKIYSTFASVRRQKNTQ